MAAKTWDTSRTGGGTYEFTQDAQGNYTLGSVGFQKLNKLNLPGLQKETTATTSQTKDTATASAQTAKAFGDVQPFYYDKKGEGGTGTQYTMRKEGDLSTETKPMVTGDGPWTMRSGAAEKPGMLGDTGGSIKRDTIPKWAQGTDRRGYENIGKKVESTNQVGRANVDQVLADRQDKSTAWGSTGQWGPKPSAGMPTERIPDRITSPLRPSIEKPKATEVITTKLKNVRTSLKPLAKAIGFVMNPVKGLVGMAAGALKDTPTQTHDRQYFNIRGDNTSRIAGNPTTDLYAGFNQVSAFGNLETAGAKRIATREKTIAKKGYKAGDKFFDDTQNMKKEQEDYKGSKDKATTKAAAEDDSQGQTGMGSCFIAGTKVSMADGTNKNIEDIVVGDMVKGQKGNNKVITLDPTLLADRKLYSFNDNEHYFFTSEHPFMTEEGWKSIKPEKTKERDGIELYDQLKGELKIGDKLVTEDGLVKITDIKSKEMNNPEMPLYNFHISNDNSYIADDHIVHNKGCFIAGTLITMADGSTKPVEQVDLGDKVAEGGKVFAAGRILINDLYDYKSIKVSGSHMVNENGKWMRIRDTKHGKLLGDDEHTVYVFGAENRRILIKGILFTDYFEVREQDKLAVVGDKYFEEWRDHDKILGNLEENHNVSVLNSH